MSTARMLLILPLLIVQAAPAAAYLRLPGCQDPRAQLRRQELETADKGWVEAQDAALSTPKGAKAWVRYQEMFDAYVNMWAKENSNRASSVLAKRILEGKDLLTSVDGLNPVTVVKIREDVGNKTEIYEWIQHLDGFQSDRSSWIKWNIGVAERIRAAKASSGRPLYEAMLQTLRTMALESGFPEKILVLKKVPHEEFTKPKPGKTEAWRRMLAQGHLFIDSQLRDEMRSTVGHHTSIVHLLQLLYVSARFRAIGYEQDFVSKRLMPELLGNNEMVDKVTFYIDKDGLQVPLQGISSWFLFFDTESGMMFRPGNPEFFGAMSHSFAADIPYESIPVRERVNYSDDTQP